MADEGPPRLRLTAPLVVLVQLALLAVAAGAWCWFAAGAPGQSVGAAAAHGLVTLVAAGVLSVHALITTAAVAYTAVRRRGSWGKLAAIHLVGLPLSVAAVAATAWIAATIDDQLLPRVRGTSAWNRAHVGLQRWNPDPRRWP